MNETRMAPASHDPRDATPHGMQHSAVQHDAVQHDAVHHDATRHRSMHHAHGHAMVHEPSAEILAAYREDFDAAQPDAGRAVVHAELRVREFEWSVAGLSLWGFGYNGQIPGPVIEAKVGDVLEASVTNELSQPTTVHWHGLRVPAAMDGTDMTQRTIEPGASFTYRFRLPDAGTFWYHPHTNEAVQMERGLYGMLIVRGDDEPQLDGEQILVLDDLTLDESGALAPFGGAVERHDGREGDIRLVNGEREPVLRMAAGQVERWRVLNVASARYVRLSLGGAPFGILAGLDGLLHAHAVTEVLLVPGDRADLVVGPFAEGIELRVEALAYDRGAIRARGTETFATLRVGPAKPSTAVPPSTTRGTPALADLSTPLTRTVRFDSTEGPNGPEFAVNGELHHRDAPVKVGELQVWDLVNETRMDHPFHLHGFFFQVLGVDGVPAQQVAWMDVVNLPARSATRIAWMPDDRPGSWMYHCHILEHHEAGMMGHFDVVR